MQQRNPFDAFDQPARGGMVIQSGPPADPSKEPLTKAQLTEAQARAANAAAQQQADTRIKNAQASKVERENDDAAAADIGAKMGVNSQLTGEAYLHAVVPPQMWPMVRAMARGDAGSVLGINRTTLPLIQHAMNYDHSFSMDNYPTRVAMQKDLASHAPGSMGNYLSALGAVAAHSKLEESAIGGLNNPSGVVGRYGGASLNNYFNNEGAATGSAFETANQTFADEKVKAIIASGAGAVADRGAALKEVSPTMAKDAQYASLRTTARQIYDKYQEQELKYARVMGGQSIPMPMRQEDAAQLLHLMRLGNDGKEGATPKDLDPKFLAFATGATPSVGGPPTSGGGAGSGPDSPPGSGGPLATGDTKSVRDPVRETAISNMFRDMVASGKIDPQAISAANVKMGGMPISTDDVAKMTAMVKGGFAGNLIDTSVSAPTTGWNKFTASPVGTGMLAALDGGMGGMSDEFASLMGGGDLADLNAKKQAAFAANPKSAFAGELAGSFADMAGISKAGSAIGLGKKALLAADLGYNALSGAGQDNDNRIAGALVGAGSSVVGMGAGALLAKPAGALARTAAGSKVVNIARDLIDSAPGPFSPKPIVPAAALTPAEQSVRTTVVKAGADKVAAALTNASDVGVPFSLADTTPSLGELAGTAARRSPAARDAADAILTPRSQGQIGRMGDAVEQNLGPIGNTLEISRALSQKAQADAAPLYAAAYAAPTPSTPEIDSLLNTPFGRESIGKARTISANERQSPMELGFALDGDGNAVLNPRPNQAVADHLFARQELDAAQDAYRQARTMPGNMDAATARLEQARQGVRDTTAALNAAPDPSVPASMPVYTTNALDYAKRGMDDVLEQYRNKLTGRLELPDAGRAQNLVKNQLLQEMDSVNPAYGEARRAFAGPMQSRDAMNLGQDLYGSNINANQVAASIADKTPEHLAQAQLGYRDAMMDRADKLSYSTNPWNILNTPAAEAKLSAMYPDNEANIAALLTQRDLERDMASTNNRVLGGSQTAGRQIADEQFLPDSKTAMAIDMGTMAAGGVPLATGARAIAGSQMMDNVRQRLAARAVAKAEAMIPMLLNPNPEASSAIVQDLMDKSTAYDAYRRATTPGGVFGRAGAAAGTATADAMYR